MPLEIVLMVLVSSVLHPAWNVILKANPDPYLGFLALMTLLTLCAFAHGLYAGVGFAALLDVLPLMAVSAGGPAQVRAYSGMEPSVFRWPASDPDLMQQGRQIRVSSPRVNQCER